MKSTKVYGTHLVQKKKELKGQIPKIKQTLEILKYSRKKCPPIHWRPDSLLEKNLLTATKNLILLRKTLTFLPNEFTNTEVKIAKVYNWNIKRKKLR